MRIIKKKIPLYFQSLVIVVAKDFNKALKKIGIKSNNQNPDDYASFVCEHENKIYLFTKKKITPGIVAHESIHICNIIFDKSCAKLDIYNDEPYAYLVGWVVDEIHKAIK